MRDARVLFTGFKLANTDWASATPEQERVLSDYALYRYGGRCNVTKSFRGELDPAVENEAAHATLGEHLREIDGLLQAATPEDARLLRQLRQFYEESPLMRVAGEKLLQIQRTKPIKIDLDSLPKEVECSRDALRDRCPPP